MDPAGNLFGTTVAGGAANLGTVFELVNTSGTYTEKVLYSFAGPPSDGQAPVALLMDSSGNLYGATAGLGNQNYGTVFELVNSSGTYSEKVLYSFAGTTGQGTASVNCCGTVFKLVNNSGNYTEEVLYNFTGGR